MFISVARPHWLQTEVPSLPPKNWRTMMELLGVQHHRTIAYHPQANGMIERLHRQIKVGLATHTDDWLPKLPFVMLGLCTAVKEALATSPTQLTFGATLHLPGEFFTPLCLHQSASQLEEQLAEGFDMVRALPPRQQSGCSGFIPRDLNKTSYDSLRIDAAKKNLVSNMRDLIGSYRGFRLTTPSWSEMPKKTSA